RAAAFPGSGSDRHPVTDGRQLRGRDCFVAQPPGGFDAKLSVGGEHIPGTSVLNRYPPRDQPGGPVWLELLGQLLVPAELCQCLHVLQVSSSRYMKARAQARTTNTR